MAPARTRSAAEPAAPKGFRVSRDLPPGRHPLLAAFPGLDQLATAERLQPDATARLKLFDGTCVQVVDEDLWMYVAPWDMPTGARRRWNPVVSPGSDCIVIGRGHLAESPTMMLFMDIFHELCHVIQRHGGAELWPPGVSYVGRWTEVEAYRFVVQEARRLGASDAYLRDYLRVEWISEDEHRQLLESLEVPPA
ncbi:MAG TPA: hypothetical protein VEG66_02670 [Thermoplasmata archaeon]|jgi:hypothetical protein|nr:hypothetical protein [Thermoplasmata archaeon]